MRRGPWLAVALLAVIAAGAASYLGRQGTPADAPTPTTPPQATLDAIARATAVTARSPFHGSCRQAGQTAAFDVNGELTVYADASRALRAEPASTTATTPHTIGVDSAWWEAAGRPAGKITLAATALDAKTAELVALTCDVELPAAP
jgi:hypothetical protein